MFYDVSCIQRSEKQEVLDDPGNKTENNKPRIPMSLCTPIFLSTKHLSSKWRRGKMLRMRHLRRDGSEGSWWLEKPTKTQEKIFFSFFFLLNLYVFFFFLNT